MAWTSNEKLVFMILTILVVIVFGFYVAYVLGNCLPLVIVAVLAFVIIGLGRILRKSP